MAETNPLAANKESEAVHLVNPQQPSSTFCGLDLSGATVNVVSGLPSCPACARAGGKAMGQRIRRPKSPSPRTTYRKRDTQSLAARYDRNNVEAMTKEQWDAWVDALPLPEFIAMCCLEDPAP